MKFSAFLQRLCFIFLLFGLFCFDLSIAEDDIEDLGDARILFDEAIELKTEGNIPDALATFEKAIRKNRGVLSLDDQGLVALLYESYKKQLEEKPDDIKVLEGMAFIRAVCFGEMGEAIKLYEKVLELATDNDVKWKTKALLERLAAIRDMSVQIREEQTSNLREERLKSWAELEKQDRLAQQAIDSRQRADTIADLYRSKDELDTRIPQLEDEVKELKDEFERARRLWFTLNDDLYDRRRRRLEREVADKEQELQKAKSTYSKAVSEIEKIEKADDAISNIDKTPVKPGADDDVASDSEVTEPQRPPEENNNPEDLGIDVDDNPMDREADEQPLPPVENPDFPDGDSDPNADAPVVPPDEADQADQPEATP